MTKTKPNKLTPYRTLDWYIKWIAACFLLSAMSIRGVEGYEFYDLVLSLIGISGWVVVSFIWNDRALIILNICGLLFLLRNLINIVFIGV